MEFAGGANVGQSTAVRAVDTDNIKATLGNLLDIGHDIGGRLAGSIRGVWGVGDSEWLIVGRLKLAGRGLGAGGLRASGLWGGDNFRAGDRGNNNWCLDNDNRSRYRCNWCWGLGGGDNRSRWCLSSERAYVEKVSLRDGDGNSILGVCAWSICRSNGVDPDG